LKATTSQSSPIPRHKSCQSAKEVGRNRPHANAKENAHSLTRQKRDGHSPSRAVMQWFASHDPGDAEIMASKSGFQESRLAAA
jgi:hypothetical protein